MTEAPVTPEVSKPVKEKPKKSMQREIVEWVITIVVAVALAFAIRAFWFEPVRVEGSSMLNTLQNGEFMIATKWHYLTGDPARFDVVICKYPGRKETFVKRIIGLPGETVEIRKGELYIDGELVEQPFAKAADTHDFPSGAYLYPEGKVPEGSYFVMGDNRDHSNDSRSIGPLTRDMIRGHVRYVVFPFANMRAIPDIPDPGQPTDTQADAKADADTGSRTNP